MLGREGVHEVGRNAVLNANYMMAALQGIYDMAYPGPCMHEFVMTLDRLHKETGVSALDIAKGLLDNGIHPPTMYFPLIVHEALMVEPTETESRATMDEAIEVFRSRSTPYRTAQYPCPPSRRGTGRKKSRFARCVCRIKKDCPPPGHTHGRAASVCEKGVCSGTTVQMITV